MTPATPTRPLAGTPLDDAAAGLDLCVHCGFCLQSCPTYLVLEDENDSPRGRLMLMRAAGDGDIDLRDASLKRHIDQCLGCRACETACPSGVPYGRLLEATRATQVSGRSPGWFTNLFLVSMANESLRRVVLGPFYSAGITENNSTVRQVLSKVRRSDNAWLLTWTIQEIFSKTERPGQKGLWSSSKATQEFYINTDDLEAARQGVSSYERHALIPHEAYQVLYAAGEAQKIFVGYKVHVLSPQGQVISDV